MTEPMSSPAAPTAGAGVQEPGGQTATQRWRRPLTVGLIILAGIVMLVASLTLWVRRQALNTDRWVEASSQLLRDDQVRHALSVYLVDAAFAQVDPAAEIADRVPPALQPLAGQLAASLRGSAINVADQTLARPGVQRTWEEINRIAHRSLIAVIDDGRGSDARSGVVLDLRPLLIEVRTRLGLGPPASPDAGRLLIIAKDKIDAARTGVKLIRGASLFLWLAVLALFGVAIWLARGWRNKALSIAGWTILAVGLALLVIHRLAGRAIVDALAGDSQARDAAHSAWLIGTTLLRDSAQAILALGALLVVGTWIAGRSAWAVAARRRLAPVFRRQPLAVYGGFLLFILLLLLVLPGGDGRQLVGTLVLFALMLSGLEALRRMTLREFPAAPATITGDPAVAAPPSPETDVAKGE